MIRTGRHNHPHGTVVVGGSGAHPGRAHSRGLHPDRAEAGVAEIARLTGLHIATASRLLVQLVDHGRDPSGHVGFGMGLHQCVGRHVARLEAEAVLSALVRRVRTIELAGEPRR